MTTEELNEYIFATLVDDRAFKLYSKDCDKLMTQGFTVDEAMAKNPDKFSYIPDAIAYLNDLRRRVSEALQESKKASPK